MRLTFFAGGDHDVIPCSVLDVEWRQLPALFATLAAGAPGAAKSSRGHWIAARLRPGKIEELNSEKDRFIKPASWGALLTWGRRRGDHLIEATAIVVDYDGRPETPPDWRPEAWPCEVFAHSSHGWHPTLRPGKWRAILRLKEAIPASEYAWVRRAVQALLPEGAICAERSAVQPAFVPTCPDDLEVQFASVPGAPLDWRALPKPKRVERTAAIPEYVGAGLTDRVELRHLHGVAKLLGEAWPAAGSGGHTAALALGGVLALADCSDEDAIAFGELALSYAGLPPGDAVAISVCNRRAGDTATKGWPELNRAFVSTHAVGSPERRRAFFALDALEQTIPWRPKAPQKRNAAKVAALPRSASV